MFQTKVNFFLIMAVSLSLSAGFEAPIAEQPTYFLPDESSCAVNLQNDPLEETSCSLFCCNKHSQEPSAQAFHNLLPPQGSQAIPPYQAKTKMSCCGLAKIEGDGEVECSLLGGCMGMTKFKELVRQCKFLWCNCYQESVDW